ncbi:MAG: N-acetyltransferase family protein [Phycisphaeraceae bacterium]
MQIRTATTDDAEAIAAFDCFGGDRPAAIQAGRCVVAEVDGDIAGYAVFKKRGLIGRDFVEFLVVRDGLRRRGVAVALLLELEARCSPGRLFISTESNNAPMLALLQRQGYRAAGQITDINASGNAERFFCRDAEERPSK